MTASSVTGIGNGSVESISTQSLNKTNILFSGKAKTNGIPLSPSGYGGNCVFQQPLPGSADSYIVVITSINGGSSQITYFNESNGFFTGFFFTTEYECEIMFIVTHNSI